MGEAIRRIGGYETVGKLGSGTVGTVYKARQVAMDRLVALKILNQRFAGNPSFVSRFTEEAKTAGRINHPNVCQVYDVGQDKGLYFFSMELVDGPSLERVIASRGKLSVSEALLITRQTASALEAAHTHGLVHRDVKPGNILLTAEGSAKLVDLGLARDVGRDGVAEDPNLVGTPYYMPPEQSSGNPVDIRGDIYALGATFYHMLTGSPPFTGPHPTAVMVKHASEPLTPPSDVDSAIPRGVSAVVEKMMAKKPEDRYADPRELIAAIDASTQVQTKAPPPPRKAGAARRSAARARTHVERERSHVRRASVASKGGGRPSGDRRGESKSNVTVPLAIAGGVAAVGLVLALVLFSGEDPAFTRAGADLTRAEGLLRDGVAASLDQAAEIARQVRNRLPPKAGSAALERRAQKVIDAARKKRIDIQEGVLKEIAYSVTKGEKGPDEGERTIKRIRESCYAANAWQGYRDRVLAACDRAQEQIKAFKAKTAAAAPPPRPAPPTPAPPRPRAAPPVPAPSALPDFTAGVGPGPAAADVGGSAPEGSPVTFVITQADELAANGSFKDALGVISASLGVFGGRAKVSLTRARKRITKKADAAFDELVVAARRDVRARRFQEAQARLTAAKGPYGFGKYPIRIEAELAAVREKAPAAPAAPGGVVDRVPPKDPGEPPGVTLVEVPPPAPAPAAAGADADKVAAAAAFIAKLGWTAEGGTWTLEARDVLKVVVGGAKRATLTYNKRGVADVDCQFEAKVVSGSGFRLLVRWADVAGRYYSSRRGRGYALMVGTAEAKLQEKGASAYYYSYTLDSDGYNTWIHRKTFGRNWNRYFFRARGMQLLASVNQGLSFNRKDQAFAQGLVRFDFVEGTEAELRKIKIVAR